MGNLFSRFKTSPVVETPPQGAAPPPLAPPVPPLAGAPPGPARQRDLPRGRRPLPYEPRNPGGPRPRVLFPPHELVPRLPNAPGHPFVMIELRNRLAIPTGSRILVFHPNYENPMAIHPLTPGPLRLPTIQGLELNYPRGAPDWPRDPSTDEEDNNESASGTASEGEANRPQGRANNTDSGSEGEPDLPPRGPWEE